MTEEKTPDADEESGLEDALESEKKAEDPVVTETGGLQTTDPSFAGGAMEVKGGKYPPEPEE